MSQAWHPTHGVQIVAGTPPGGGLDRVARALAKAIGEARLIDVPVEVVTVPGGGARKAWTQVVDKHAGDAHVVAISSPNLTTDFLVGVADFEHSKYTPIATLVTEYIAFAVRTDSVCTAAAICWRASRKTRRASPPRCRPRSAIPITSRSPNSSSRPAATSTRRSIHVFDSALDCVADVIAGKADVCAVTAASVIAELNAGRLRVLAISAPARLAAPFANVPTWSEQGADCVIGAWRGVSGPSGLCAAQVKYWEGVILAATRQPCWAEDLARLSWSPQVATGAALRDDLARERAEFVAVLGELGLLKA